MTFEDIYNVSQIVAVIVVVATLFAILWQGFQTNKIARADLTLALWMHAGAAHYSLMDSPEKAAFMHRAMSDGETLTDSEKFRFANIMGYAIGSHEAAFNLRQRGLVEPAAYDRNAGLTRLYFQSRRVRKWWSIRRDFGYDSGFRTIIDGIANEFDNDKAAPAIQEKSA